MLPQTKIKSARGFTILTQNKNFACVCLQFVRGQSGGLVVKPATDDVEGSDALARDGFLQSFYVFCWHFRCDHSVGSDA